MGSGEHRESHERSEVGQEELVRRWQMAWHQVTLGLLANAEPRDVLVDAAKQARLIADADTALVALPDDADQDILVVDGVSGVNAGKVRELRVPITASMSGEVYRSGRPKLVRLERDGSPMAHGLLVPFGTPGATRGVVVLTRRVGRDPFDAALLPILHTFAAQVAVAVELMGGRGQPSSSDELGFDLNDIVIDRIFAVALVLSGLAERMDDPSMAGRISQALSTLDGTVQLIRGSVLTGTSRGAAD